MDMGTGKRNAWARLSILSFVIPLLFSCAALLLRPAGAMDVYEDPEDYEDSPVLHVLGSGAVAGWPVHQQLQCSDFWSQLFRSTTEKVGALWKLRLFGPGRPYCDHSHREVL